MGKCIYLRKGTVHTPPRVSILASSLAVGETVKLMEDGVETEFIVVNQGLPSNMYDASCNGTWLLRKDIKENRVWNSSNNNAYATSTINTWLNGDYINSLGTIEQGIVKQVKIPYIKYTGVDASVASGDNGLNVKAFLLGGYEVGFTISTDSKFYIDGEKLSYFEVGTNASANNRRIALLNNSPTIWYLRSPTNVSSAAMWHVKSDGLNAFTNYPTSASGIRPCLILPFTAEFDSNTKVLTGGGIGGTWFLNETIMPQTMTGINFTVVGTGKNYNLIQYTTDPSWRDVVWYGSEAYVYIVADYTGQMVTYGWQNQSDRTIQVAEPITDEFATWLQANGVKQE